MVKIKPPINVPIDKINCHVGTPNGTKAGITTGEVNGIIDAQNASGVCGCCTILIIINIEARINKVTGIAYICTSVSSSPASEPIAANHAA